MSGPLVVTRQAPRYRRVQFIVLAAALLLTAGWGLLEIGARQAGYDRAAVSQERRAQNRELAELRRQNQSLRERITLLETSGEIDRQAYREVEASLAELQAAVQAREEELQFYRNIVSPEDRVPGLRLERAQLERLADDRFALQLVIVQALRQVDRLEGSITLTLIGRDLAGPRTLDLSEWLHDETGSVDFAFAFRYFQELSWEFRLPEGFAPTQLRIELTPSGRNAVPLSHSMDWPKETTG